MTVMKPQKGLRYTVEDVPTQALGYFAMYTWLFGNLETSTHPLTALLHHFHARAGGSESLYCNPPILYNLLKTHQR